MRFDPKDNPLRDVKVLTDRDVDFDSQRVAFRILNGSDKDYKKHLKQEILKGFTSREKLELGTKKHF